MRTLLAFIDRHARALEERPIPGGPFVAAFGALVLARHLLEILAGQNPVYFPLQFFIHYPLAYVAPLLALVLVLHLFSGVPVVRVTRLMLYAWALTLLPPLVDLAAGEAGEGIGYLRMEDASLGEIFARFFDPRARFGGTTVGIRVEAALACLLGGLYVWLRARAPASARAARALGAAAGVYVTALGFFTLPRLFDAAAGFWLPARGSLHAPPTYLEVAEPVGLAVADRICVLYLVPLCLLLGAAWMARAASWTGAVATLRRLPWVQMASGAILAGGGIALGAALARQLAGVPLKPAPLDLLAAAGLVGAAALLPAGLRVAAAGDGMSAEGLSTARGSGLALALAAACLSLAAGWVPATLLAVAAGLLWVRRPGGALDLPRWPPAAEAATGLAGLALLGMGISWGVAEQALALTPPAVAWGVLLAGSLAALAARWARGPEWAGLACGAAAALALPVAGGAPAAVVVACGIAALAALLPRLAGRRLGWLEGLALPGLLALGLAGVLVPEEGRSALVTQVLHRPKFLIGQAMDLEASGRHAEAVAAYRRALAVDPGRAPVLARLGEILWLRLDQPEAAREAYGAALAADPDQIPARQQLASLLLQEGDPGAAAAVLAPGLERRPDHALLLRTLALALERIPGRRLEAADAWRRYLQASDVEPGTEAERAHARSRLRSLEEDAPQ